MHEHRARIAEADRLRPSDPSAARRLLAACPPETWFDDEERVAAFIEACWPRATEETLPALRHGAKHASGLSRRNCLHLVALHHWYGSEIDAARDAWTEAIELGRDIRDVLWLKTAQNLSLVYARKGRVFETLSLIGMVLRGARLLDDPALEAFATVRHAVTMDQVGESELAERSLDEVEALLPRVSEPVARVVVLSSLHETRAKVLYRKGDLAGAHAQEVLRSAMLEEAGDRAEPALVVASLSNRLAYAFGLSGDPEERAALLEEYRRIPETVAFDPRWEVIWRNGLHKLEFDEARRSGASTEDLGERGAALVESIPPLYQGDERMRRLIEIARDLEAVGAGDAAARAYELAADTAIERLSQARPLFDEFPAMFEPSPEDRQVYVRVSDRLAEQYDAISEALHRVWRPGMPLHDWVVGDRGLIRACGWCRRALTPEGSWVPVLQYIPSSAEVQVTHGICPECSADPSWSGPPTKRDPARPRGI